MVSIEYAPASAAAARDRLSQELRDMPRSFVDDARLVVTELVSNALRHARPLADGTVRVSWRYEAGCLEVAVTDGGSPTLPQVARATEDSLGGRGLAIVSAIADDWGIRREGSTTSVWAMLALASDLCSDRETNGGFSGSA
jgi:anti-sigma regulatory factor (Ser/Thr protein kinase)